MSPRLTEDRPDAYLRWRIKKSYARFQPPSDGKKRLLHAAFQETTQSGSQFHHLNSMIENEEYQENHAYLSWMLASRFHMTFLSTIKLR